MKPNFLFQFLILYQIRKNVVLGWKYKVLSTKAKSESLTDKLQSNISITESSGLSLYIDLKEDLNDLFTTVNLAVNLHTTDEYDFHLMQRTVDCCKLFKNTFYESEIQYFYQMFSENGHLPKGCPVKKGLYYFHGDIVSVDSEKLPQLMTETKKAFLTIKMSVKERNKFKVLAKFQVYFTVEKIENVTFVGMDTTESAKDVGLESN